jgi:uridine phosphorylase
MKAVKRLSPDELREFKRQFEKWQKQNGKQVEEEKALLACIEENSRLPAAGQRRFNRLRRKHQTETLTESEEEELQAFWQRVEQMNVARLEALVKLAKLRGTHVRALMRELGLVKILDVF